MERELREELSIIVNIKDFFYQVEYDYPDFHLSMALYRCDLVSHDIKMNVHKGLKWVKPEDIMSLDWAPADVAVAREVLKKLGKHNEK